MTLRARAVVLPLALAAVCLFGRDAHACSCARVSPCESAAHASAVFVGHVTRVAQEPRKISVPDGAGGEKSVTADVMVSRLRVEEVLLGSAGEEVEIRGWSDTCDYHFAEGRRYVVYADPGDGRTLSTSICSGTKPLADADGRPAAGESIELLNPVTGYREDNGVTADAQGRFSLEGVEGQTYDLSAKVSSGGRLVNSKPLRITVRAKNKPVRLVIEH